MIVATAGHIDHGKTALVRALTGVDCDRLPQEKARGISIDIGFAYATTARGATLGFVDVPGHERFVRNMLAGVCGIDNVMLIVAADDGVMPQTREHVAILDLLAVTRGIVVISKIDCVGAARVAEVHAEVETLLAVTGLAGAPVVEVSAVTGEGIDALRARLDQEADADADEVKLDPRHGFRYAIDRAFSIAGSGTVVTGTVFDGAASVGDRLVLSPLGIEVRVRAIQKAGVVAERAEAGERCALNLVGVERSRVDRGQWIVAHHAPTSRLDVELRLLDDAQPLRHWAQLHLHIGTADIAAKVSIAQGRSLSPGGSARVQLICDSPVPAVVGDRFIARDVSAVRTIGGGVVLDSFPPSRRISRAVRAAQIDAHALLAPERALPALMQATPAGVDATQFGHAFNLTPDCRDALVRAAGAVLLATRPQRALPAETVHTIKSAALAALVRFHADSPQSPGLELALLRRAVAPDLSLETFTVLMRSVASELKIEMTGSIVCRVGHVATANRADEVLWQRIKPLLADAGFRGQLLRDLAADLRMREPVLSDFMHRKAVTADVVRVSPQRFYPREVMAQLAALATAIAADAPDNTFIAARFRDRAGVNRTLAIEILECLDRLGITQRVGDARKIRRDFVAVLGPAATVARAAASGARSDRRPAQRTSP